MLYLRNVADLVWLIRLYKIAATLMNGIPALLFFIKRYPALAVVTVFTAVVGEKIHLLVPVVTGMAFFILSVSLHRNENRTNRYK
ncbi:MAG: hypothetical protein IJ242_15980 [Clostridia bacterium]|nr:hypothetical protein [Clostridia bacterium]